tara:strand:- start:11584 stop:12399 length:816 start_codon:yes stop_codon:yes gene_type:complete
MSEFQNFLISKLYDQTVKTPFNKKEDIEILFQISQKLIGFQKVINQKDDFSYETIQKIIEQDAIKFVKAWALMEPQIIKDFVKANYDYELLAKDYGTKPLQYKMIPTDNLQYAAHPERLLLEWDKHSIICITDELIRLFCRIKNNEKFHHNDYLNSLGRYKPRGYGYHTLEHLIQVWLFVLGSPHPSRRFIHMYKTGGDCERRLKFEFGQISIKKINKKLKEYHSTIQPGSYALISSIPKEIVINHIDNCFVCPILDYGTLSYYMHRIYTK